jgi:hypothetical protein
MSRQISFAVFALTFTGLMVAQSTPTQPPRAWTAAQLRPSAAIQNSYFGFSVSAGGNTVVVAGTGESGSAYVYVEPSGGWRNMTQTAKLTPSGYVAISGDTIVSCCSASSAYAFVKPTDGWVDMSETATLMLPQRADSFYSIAISGDTVVVGNAASTVNGNSMQGAAYVFVKPVGGWSGTIQPVATLTASDGVADDLLGESVSVDGDVIVAGAPTALQGVGSAYVFVKPAGGWSDMTQTAKLTSSAPQGLGLETSVSGNVVLESGYFAGYVYAKPAGGWTDMTETAQLAASPSGFIPTSLSISGSTVVMGDAFSSNDEPAGLVCLFREPKDGWQDSTMPNLAFNGGAPNTLALGYSVALSGSTLVAGAPYVNNNSGVAYVAVPK